MTSFKRLYIVGVLWTGAVLAASAFGAAHDPAEDAVPNIENSVVKVFSTVRHPDPFKPWTKQAPNEISGSGVVIEGKRILTNAHVVCMPARSRSRPNAAATRFPPPWSR